MGFCVGQQGQLHYMCQSVRYVPSQLDLKRAERAYFVSRITIFRYSVRANSCLCKIHYSSVFQLGLYSPTA